MRIEFGEIGPDDLALLEEMLYQALFVPEGETPYDRSVLEQPEIARYAAGWGRPGDFGLTARTGTEAAGTAWFRLFPGDAKGFGYVDDRTPELSVAVRPDLRGLGLGSSLLQRLISAARERGFERLSLSVDGRNPALRLYERLGFETVAGTGGSLTMVRDLRAAGVGTAGRDPLADSIARAMDGSDGRIVPFLPYVLQDSWELGTDPEIVIDLVRRHARDLSRLRVADLGCGKGPVSVRLAAALGCRCLGIDGIPEFIDCAEAKAAEAGVARLCLFEVADIRERVEGVGRFDVIVLGAIGPVFGDYRATLGRLAPHLSEGGLVVLDDGFLPDDSEGGHPQVLGRGEAMRQIAAAGMRLAEEVPIGRDAVKRQNETLFRDLEKRCLELMERFPERKAVFEDYIRRQVEENEFLEGDVECAVLAVKR